MGGALEFSEVGDAPGVTVRMDGVLVVTDFPAGGEPGDGVGVGE